MWEANPSWRLIQAGDTGGHWRGLGGVGGNVVWIERLEAGVGKASLQAVGQRRHFSTCRACSNGLLLVLVSEAPISV